MSASPADFVAIENALVAWLRAVSTYDVNHVYIANQDSLDHGPGARLVVDLGELSAVGLDASVWRYSALEVAGSEMVNTTEGLRFLECMVSAYSPTTTGSSATARSVLSAVQDSLALDTYRNALNAAGLGVLLVGPVQSVPKIDRGNFEGRAVLQLRFSLRVSAVEKTGYISKITGTITPSPAAPIAYETLP